MSLVIKTFFQDDVRRITVGQDTYASHAALRDKIKQAYGSSSDSFVLRWKDRDGDLVSLTSDSDLQEALQTVTDGVLRVFITLAATATPPVTPAASAPASSPQVQEQADAQDQRPRWHGHGRGHGHGHGHGHGFRHFQEQAETADAQGQEHAQQRRGCPWRQFRQQQQQQQPEQTAFDAPTNPERHVGVVCDGCQGAIVGSRFKCTVCPDFDLCATCEQRGLHSAHDMVRIRTPRQPWTREQAQARAQARAQAHAQARCAPGSGWRQHLHPFVSFFQDLQGAFESEMSGEPRTGCRRANAGCTDRKASQQTGEDTTASSHATQAPADPAAASPTTATAPEATWYASADAKAAEAAAQADDAHEAETGESFAEQLDALHAMGFENDDMLLHVLRRNKGAIQRVLNELLQ